MKSCGVGVGPVPRRALGRRDRHLQRRACCAGEEWYDAGVRRARAPTRGSCCWCRRRRWPRRSAGAFNMKGPVLSVDTACAASANAIGYASELIRDGHADAVLTGGTDALLGHPHRRLQLARVAVARAGGPVLDRPQGALARRGQRHARADAGGRRRGAGRCPILAEIVGYGLSADGYHPTAPHPEGKGASRAIKTRASSRPASRPTRSTTSTATAPVRPRTTPPRPRPRRSASARRRRVQGRGQQHQVDDRPPARRRGRGRGDRHREGARGPGRPADRELHGGRPRVRPRLRAERAARGEVDVALSNNFAFGGANASRPVHARGRARRRRRPGPIATGWSSPASPRLTSAGTDLDDALGGLQVRPRTARATRTACASAASSSTASRLPRRPRSASASTGWGSSR